MLDVEQLEVTLGRERVDDGAHTIADAHWSSSSSLDLAPYKRKAWVPHPRPANCSAMVAGDYTAAPAGWIVFSSARAV